MFTQMSENQLSQLTTTLDRHLLEYLRHSQEISFNGSEEDRREFNEYASTVLDLLVNLRIGEDAVGKVMWSFEDFKRAKSEWKPTISRDGIIDAVIYNVGSHSNSLHTGEKWLVTSQSEKEVVFESVADVEVSSKDLIELKQKYSQVEDVILTNSLELGKVNLLLKFSLDLLD
jgi:hypothetical protein